MHRVFTHLRLATGLSIHGEKRFFFENPDFPTLVDGKQSNKTTKVLAQQPGGRARLFFSFYLFIYLFHLIN